MHVGSVSGQKITHFNFVRTKKLIENFAWMNSEHFNIYEDEKYILTITNHC